jgi:hypothetical protein
MTSRGSRFLGFVTRRRLGRRGQVLAEVGFVLPLLTVLFVGTLQFGYVLYQGHVVHKVAREAANMLSRQVTLDATAAAIHDWAVPHLGAFDGNAKLILSVLQVGTAGSNAGTTIITQRYSVGNLTATSLVGNPPSSAYAGTANHPALDPAENAGIRATSPLPNGLTLGASDTVFVAELFIDRKDIANIIWPVSIVFPDTLYGSAFF